ncbi:MULTISPECIES: ABC transporter substrate-binding protein [Sphingomonas]|uniref:ABC transporter substrate-binding protein n=1 Tax=Sphingomonas TaxID=13687 RepID=UPI0004DB7EF5|nr:MULTISPECIES: ABC transporter substrate-binding protein [Sphingomonas]KQM91732.1 iron ABC transporter [Sphingomonas sp. Leaf226]MDY0967122.1 ABC transporter substrate-binding protein [Sphingomonas sp. CFBP9021]USQ99064.1 ABC transporter substrate-binding protein [Sphingomonas aerolata]
MRRRRLLTILIIAAAGASAAAAAPRPPARIVSLNLCADQYLLALADPAQIVALTRFARDPNMSAAANAARTIPVSRGSAEDVLMLRPDLVISSPFRRQTVAAVLAGRNVATLDLPPADSYTAIVTQVRQVAAAIGHPDRGETLIRRMDTALARLPRAPGGGRTAAYYQRRGFLTGTGTLVDELMQRLGLANLATRLGKPALSQLSLEQMALARPDYLVVESATDRVTDQGTEMLHHPILDGIPRLRIPEAWTVCGGPAYVLAAQSLAAQLRTQRPASPRRDR